VDKVLAYEKIAPEERLAAGEAIWNAFLKTSKVDLGAESLAPVVGAVENHRFEVNTFELGKKDCVVALMSEGYLSFIEKRKYV
jgi:hypothetical protein